MLTGQFQTKPIANVDTDDMIGLIKDSRLTDQSNLVIRKSTPDGIEVIYAMAQLKGGDWIMIIQQDAADAFSDLKRTQRIVFSLFS
jgi:two-component system NtrC family sensor kinase